jgi:uracil phosphoribosyltransferase
MPAHLVEHPLVSERLTHLRMTSTARGDFRRNLTELSTFVIYESLRSIETTTIDIDTPLEPTTGVTITAPPLLVPVMRAGLGMLDAALLLLPDARVGFIGLKRDEETLLPHAYANTVPEDLEGQSCLVLDPMLATGGSLAHTCELLNEANAGQITVACVLASPEGIALMDEHYPTIDVWTGAIDEALNEVGFIRPGLGDAGDRQFGFS